MSTIITSRGPAQPGGAGPEAAEQLLTINGHDTIGMCWITAFTATTPVPRGIENCVGRYRVTIRKAEGAGSGPELRHLFDGRNALLRQPLHFLLCGPDAPRHAPDPVFQGRRWPAELPAGQLYHPDQPDGAGGPAHHRPAHQPHQRLRPHHGPPSSTAPCWATRTRALSGLHCRPSARRASS